MNKKHVLMVFVLILVLVLSFVSWGQSTINTKAQATSNCFGFSSPRSGNAPANCLGTVVVNDAWLSWDTNTDPSTNWEFYRLRFEDRVIVNWEENGYYFVVWYFDNTRDPLGGWVKKDKILLDVNVVH